MSIGAQGINHVAIACDDLHESRRFYVDILGLTEDTVLGPPDGPNIKLDAGGGTFLELFRAEDSAKNGAQTLIQGKGLGISNANLEKIPAAE